MAKVCAPDRACKQITYQGRTYTARGGVFTVPDGAVGAFRDRAECFTPTGGPSRARGFVCPACGFVAVFPTDCGRCGHPTLNPEEP